MEKSLKQEKPMRRRPWALGFVLFLGLVMTGGGYAAATAAVENVAPATNQQAKEWPEQKKMNHLIQQAEALLKERTSPMASASARRARRDTRQKTTNKTKSMAPNMDSTPSLPPTDTWSDKDLSREDPKDKEQEAPGMVRGRLYNLNTDRSKLPNDLQNIRQGHVTRKKL